ncbi:proteasome-interacting protein cic1 [Yamadazyma tenuis]|uniref:Ribosomal protein L1 n=1 Tax=Candida tenuis (strain ATCC 10573 / BCRC 21748 / CBS 615 / JCM 9827 / NBRC 10315 / NRRL Y-1498 / VKM Y-70) TaxID=590646 RepID=G3BBW1_CANTC|nr:ribosomal protein L1 [Yamadazyma tenuis ATCC 10573]EGV60093.1 ribosomal protein L1 [Yamadazyma tenuis ATCC 10573]WEJ94671.1 proteasome-interacting protein cic1 [Yamadazyma tenuis]
MAKTRSKGPVSPKTPLSDKIRKIKTKTSVEASPSVRKVKKGRVEKSAKPSTTTSTTVSTDVVSDKVARGAVEQLSKYTSAQAKESESDLFADEEDDEYVYLQVTTKKFFSDKPNFKPKVIKLSHPIIKEQSDLKTCLIVRDSLITKQEQVEKIESEQIPTLQKIYTLHDIKTEFKPFEKKRQLYNEYDLFVVDDALMNSLPSALGKVFYDNGNNKIPLPIRVTSSNSPKQFSTITFKNQLDKCLTSTFFLPPMGVNILIKLGVINKSSTDDLAQNIKDVMKTFEVSSLRSAMIKTSSSPALPVFYSDKLYDSVDVLEKAKSAKKSDKSQLSAFEKGLLELGTTEDVTKIIGKKLGQKLSS